MKDQKMAVAMVIATVSLFVSASALGSDLVPEIAPRHQVDSCVAEISNYADFSDATRVYHDVKSRQRRTIGHTLRINTRVYGEVEDEVIREYATKCVVGTEDKPTRFTIIETTAGA